MKKFLTVICLLSPLISFSQDIEWANKVIGFSSQLNEKVNSANQVLGKPSKLPLAGRSTCAWVPKASDNLSNEYLIVSFKNSLIANQILIAENYNAGHIQSIYIYDSVANGKLIYTRSELPAEFISGRLFSLQLKDNTQSISALKIVFDECDQFNSYQIDAIGITKSKEPVILKIHEITDGTTAKAENLGTSINSAFDEVCPIISPDGNTLYFDRKLHPENTGEYKLDDIWYANYISEIWGPAVNIREPLNNKDANFLCSISPDGNSALLGGSYGSKGTGVAIATRTAAGWSVPKPVQIRGFVNVNSYNEFYLGADGTTLLMSIENSESFGLRDLYVSFMQGDGTFSKPENLGRTINTAGDEMSPFLAADGKTLYFSTNGYPGYGGPDIFMSKRIDASWNNWTEPINLGSNVNSPDFDVYYSIDAKGEYAYFSSGYTSKTNLDIFRIKLPPQAQPENVVWLKGMVSDRTTNEFISANIQVYDFNDSLLISYSSSTPTTGYAVLIPGNSLRKVKISADGYYGSDTLILVHDVPVFTEVVQNFSLIPQKTGVIIEMKNIEFEANSSILEDTSFAELDKVVKFLVANPLVSIEVRGHTNGLCGDDYCNSLSLKRAMAVVDYFVSKGISRDRLNSKGLGKTMPIADNKTQQGRMRNQRVEFMITKVN